MFCVISLENMFYSVLDSETSPARLERLNVPFWTEKVAVFFTISQKI